eukprot:Lankesteria_metandrocarpae@DN4673_c0_g1_i4.p1
MNDTLMNVYTNLNKQCLSLSFVTLLRDLQDLYEGRDVQCPFEQGDTETDTDLQQQEQWRSAPLNLRWAQPANFHELLKSVSLPQEDLLETFGSIHQALEEMEIEMQEAFINAVDDTFHLDINDAKCGRTCTIYPAASRHYINVHRSAWCISLHCQPVSMSFNLVKCGLMLQSTVQLRLVVRLSRRLVRCIVLLRPVSWMNTSDA